MGYERVQIQMPIQKVQNYTLVEQTTKVNVNKLLILPTESVSPNLIFSSLTVYGSAGYRKAGKSVTKLICSTQKLPTL